MSGHWGAAKSAVAITLCTVNVAFAAVVVTHTMDTYGDTPSQHCEDEKSHKAIERIGDNGVAVEIGVIEDNGSAVAAKEYGRGEHGFTQFRDCVTKLIGEGFGDNGHAARDDGQRGKPARDPIHTDSPVSATLTEREGESIA